MRNAWQIVTLGHLTRNIYWGESNGLMYHPCIATCTVVQSDYGNILIDPSLPAERLAKELYHKSGVRAEDISYVFCTHNHLDHWTGTEAFPNARICMPEKDLEYLKEDRALYTNERGPEIDRMVGVKDELVPGFRIIPLPGHSLGLSGLLFDGPEGRILATGDACMGKEYFHAKRGYFWSADYTKSSKSIEKAAGLADVIIPGHGNYFNVQSYLYEPETEDEIMPQPASDRIESYTKLKDVINSPRRVELILEQMPLMNEAALRIARDVPLEALILNMPERLQREKDAFLEKLNNA